MKNKNKAKTKKKTQQRQPQQAQPSQVRASQALVQAQASAAPQPSTQTQAQQRAVARQDEEARHDEDLFASSHASSIGEHELLNEIEAELVVRDQTADQVEEQDKNDAEHEAEAHVVYDKNVGAAAARPLSLEAAQQLEAAARGTTTDLHEEGDAAAHAAYAVGSIASAPVADPRVAQHVAITEHTVVEEQVPSAVTEHVPSVAGRVTAHVAGHVVGEDFLLPLHDSVLMPGVPTLAAHVAAVYPEADVLTADDIEHFIPSDLRMAAIDEDAVFQQHMQPEQHPLFAVLQSYHEARQTLSTGAAQLEQVQASIVQCEESVWTEQKQVMVKQGMCRDKSRVEMTREFFHSSMNNAALSGLEEAYGRQRSLILNYEASHLYVCCVCTMCCAFVFVFGVVDTSNACSHFVASLQ